MTIAQDVKQAAVDRVVELYVLDGTSIGAPVFYFTPNVNPGGTGSVDFQGQTYTAFPIVMEGIQKSTDGASPRPTLRVSNVTRFLQSYVAQYGDLVGARVRRMVTLAKYLDTGTSPGNQLLLDDTYVIDQKKQNKTLIEFTLASVIDVPGKNLPGRTVLRQNFPGAGLTRAR